MAPPLIGEDRGGCGREDVPASNMGSLGKQLQRHRDPSLSWKPPIPLCSVPRTLTRNAFFPTVILENFGHISFPTVIFASCCNCLWICDGIRLIIKVRLCEHCVIRNASLGF